MVGPPTFGWRGFQRQWCHGDGLVGGVVAEELLIPDPSLSIEKGAASDPSERPEPQRPQLEAERPDWKSERVESAGRMAGSARPPTAWREREYSRNRFL